MTAPHLPCLRYACLFDAALQAQKRVGGPVGIGSESGSTSGTRARTSSWNRRANFDAPALSGVWMKTRLRDHLKKGHKQRLYGWFQQWAGIEAQATVLRWYEPLVVPGLLQTEEYARAILSPARRQPGRPR